ncbi:uncharacterized protein LOC126413017 [Schistocerca serialis cubense]|uniref:uncharacterized protein LOC126413017 n=1 Tax=Schistocerca serialis cubense TaxID=2023355 RepID=UPI00214E2B04|nr:uncharacterized protein LOC126413017 [Schistocerca serialis cubense]
MPNIGLLTPVLLASAGQVFSRISNYKYLVRGGFQPRLPTSLPPPGQQQQPSPLPRRQPVPLMPPAQLHPGAPQVVAPAPAVPLQSPPPSELMDVDPSAGPPSQAVAVQPVLQPLSLGTPKESDTAAPCPAPTQQPSTQRQETLPLFVGPDAPSRPVPEAAPKVTGVHPDLGFQDTAVITPVAACVEHSGRLADVAATHLGAPRPSGVLLQVGKWRAGGGRTSCGRASRQTGAPPCLRDGSNYCGAPAALLADEWGDAGWLAGRPHQGGRATACPAQLTVTAGPTHSV